MHLHLRSRHPVRLSPARRSSIVANPTRTRDDLSCRSSRLAPSGLFPRGVDHTSHRLGSATRRRSTPTSDGRCDESSRLRHSLADGGSRGRVARRCTLSLSRGESVGAWGTRCNHQATLQALARGRSICPSCSGWIRCHRTGPSILRTGLLGPPRCGSSETGGQVVGRSRTRWGRVSFSKPRAQRSSRRTSVHGAASTGSLWRFRSSLRDAARPGRELWSRGIVDR